MRRTFLILVAFCAIFASCNRDEEGQPIKKERNMVKKEMTWTLDSVLVIYDYQTDIESRVTITKEDGLYDCVFTFHPAKYKFPSDMYAISWMEDTIYYADRYADNYCKYENRSSDGSLIAAGYLCYYNDQFCMNGLKAGGAIDFRIVEATTDWNVPVWTMTYNKSESDTGNYVYERRVEYYSNTK